MVFPSRIFSIAIIFLLLVSCAPQRRAADRFEQLLVCGIESSKLKSRALSIGATTIQDEKEMMLVSFEKELFALFFDDLELIAAERKAHDYFLFFDGDEYSDQGMKVILDCQNN